MKQFFAICLLTSIISSCSTKSNTGQPTKNSLVTSSKTALTADKHSEDTQPEKIIVEFLKWYKDNNDQLHINETINNYPPTNDSAKYYSVNFVGTERYLSELKKSSFVSDKYLNNWRQYFKKCDVDLKMNPQNDGPPEGFEFDFIMQSQEYDEDLAAINEVKIVKQQTDNNKAFLVIEFPSKYRLGYWLTKEQNKWLIDDIQNKTGE